jgi:membrane protease subunit HflK
MRAIIGWGARLAASLNGNRGGPWGSSGGDGDGGGGGDEGGGPKSPWGQPPRKRRPISAGGNIASIEDFFRKGRDRFGGRFPHQDGRPYWAYGLAVFVLLWIIITSFHQLGPQQQGVVTFFGKYSRTVGPGISMTLPFPLEQMQKVDTGEIRYIDIGSTEANNENLILTGDQNLIDVAYAVRWKIRDPQMYLFRIKDAEETIKEVAESAMRAVISTLTLEDAIGVGRSAIEQRVTMQMQQTLDSYGAGIQIEGITVKQTDPPAAVNDAFKEVTSAQQEAQSYRNQARAYAQQEVARAQGEAASFDKVYAQYKLSPEVTRKRMYYETMERVLSKVDKTIVEAPNVTPYLALPEIRGRAKTPAVAAEAPR